MDDPDAREANYKKALEYMDAAEILGAKTVRLDAGGDHKAKTFTNEQMDYIVPRYQEYCQRAYDNGYKFGPENHWGPEVVPENMKAICEAVDHPGFGVLIHFRGEGDELFAPWAMHTHVAWACMENHLNESMNLLKGLGYEGYWGVEHHTGENEYTEVAMQIAAVRDVLNRWRMADKACGCGCGCGCK